MINQIIIESSKANGVSDSQIMEALEKSLQDNVTRLKKVLLLPPDLTRMHSGAGKITAMYYNMLKDKCKVDILPALGTHDPMSEQECKEFFGDSVPMESIIAHNWRKDIVKIGEVPGDFVSSVSDGLLNYTIDVEVNRLLIDKSYDLIISIGQVVPHEVVGMANYNKNIFVGCGGKDIINKSHMLGAVYGMEKIMGRDFSPVRKVFDYAEENFYKDAPLMYVLTVNTFNDGNLKMEGLFIGRERKVFEEAVKLSQEKNLIFLDKPLKKVVVYLDSKEFKSTWLGNKSIYRTRMAIADGGELIVLAPAVKKFGEDESIDTLIRKYGYVGSKKILELYKKNDDLQQNLSAAAHLIHGSSESRFSITYAVENITKEEIEGVNFNYMPLKDAIKKYDPFKLKEGYNTMDDGEKIFFISNPALGLWADKNKF
ncbi:MAG TPA: lactate racemase domain-containing protein [Clostridia bacterium]|nr:lactate racemase domain-containing protein [Clostridia bacterium]